MILKCLIFIFNCLLITNLTHAELALVVVPIADLISDTCNNFNTKISPASYYKQIPLSPTYPGKKAADCPRLHQALFNEIVDIVKTGTHEFQVKILNAYCLDPATKQKNALFWTLKSNLVPLKSIINKHYLPTPINYCNPINHDPQTVTLIRPWRHFSAGTRFKINPKDNTCYCYELNTNKFVKLKIPKKFISKPASLDEDQLRANFVNLVQNWCHTNGSKIIPYVWGGCSFVHKTPKHKIKKFNKNGLEYYDTKFKHGPVHSGLDCSGLVLRASQIFEIPYFYKNSSTLAHELTPLNAYDEIKPGDLIWLNGHVIIIIEPHTGMCIEARHYGHGYGQLQQIHISKLFKEINNLSQLKAAHLKCTPITRIDKDSNLRGKYKIKILKLIKPKADK